MYDSGCSSVEIARIFNREGVRTPAQIREEKGDRKASSKGGRFVWQHTSILRILHNRVYAGDLVACTRESRGIRGKREMTDPDRWIITENHHEPVVDRELFDRVQMRFSKTRRKWERKDTHVLVGRVTCGCCDRTLRHDISGYPYYWCPGLHEYQLEGCVKHIDDFFSEREMSPDGDGD